LRLSPDDRSLAVGPRDDNCWPTPERMTQFTGRQVTGGFDVEVILKVAGIGGG
jgi:hypothetical protein